MLDPGSQYFKGKKLSFPPMFERISKSGIEFKTASGKDSRLLRREGLARKRNGWLYEIWADSRRRFER